MAFQGACHSSTQAWRGKKKLVSHCLRIYFLLFIDFGLGESWSQRPWGFSGDHLLRFTDQEIEVQKG